MLQIQSADVNEAFEDKGAWLVLFNAHLAEAFVQ